MSYKSRAFASAARHTLGRNRKRGSPYITPVSPASAAMKLVRWLFSSNATKR
jgi:hypothetical protein